MSVRELKSGLERARVKADEISIIIHNFENLVSIVVHNLVNSSEFRAKFIKNPARAVSEANPQPSP